MRREREREKCFGLYVVRLSCSLTNMCESNKKNRNQGTHVIWRNLEIFYKVGSSIECIQVLFSQLQYVYSCCIARFLAISPGLVSLKNSTLIFFLPCHRDGYLKRIEIGITRDFYNCQMITYAHIVSLSFASWLELTLLSLFVFYIIECLFQGKFFSLLREHVLSFLTRIL